MEIALLAALIAWACLNLHKVIWLYRRSRRGRINEAEMHRRWALRDLTPWPFLRPALKKLDRAAAAAVTEQLDRVTAGRRDRELTEAEELADLDLFQADPRLAVELGYEVPVHTCRWSRAYRSGNRPGPFTCDVCGKPWVLAQEATDRID